MSNMYFIIRPIMDRGGARVEGPMSQEDLIKKITPDKFGDSGVGCRPHFCTELPDFDDTPDDENPVVIIRGEFVVPKPVQIATEFDL